MLKAVLDSFLRSIIRFWDNRFLPEDNPLELYREEVIYLRRRNEELASFILNSIEVKTAQVNESESDTDQLQSIGRPIETTLAKRRRLEQESLAEWNRGVQEAREKMLAQAKVTTKSTEELEADLGVKN